MTIHRDAEFALRLCIERVDVPYFVTADLLTFGDDTALNEAQAACSAASDHLEVEDARLARELAVDVTYINVQLGFLALDFTVDGAIDQAAADKYHAEVDPRVARLKTALT